MGKNKKKIPIDLKYKLYEESVQAFEGDIDFINKEFKRFRKRKPLSLYEDFGGTGILSCEWVKQSDKHTACAIDLDPEPIKHGRDNHYAILKAAQQSRMVYLQENVLNKRAGKCDVNVAFNFSYFIFKTREDLLKYFKRVKNSLNDEGVFFVDIFGGSDARKELMEETEYDEHSYYWDCDSYNPITGEVLYYIHFKTHKNDKMYRKVFTYDWRMWTPVEIKEIMYEVGFKDVLTYWEGEDEDGDGDGEFTITSDVQQCDSWVSYIAGLV